MKSSEAFHSLKLKFRSANSIPVERAAITRQEWDAILSLALDMFSKGFDEGYQVGVEDASAYHLGPMRIKDLSSTVHFNDEWMEE